MNPEIIYNNLFDGRRLVSAVPAGVCSRQIDIVLVGDSIEEVLFTGGCQGNTQGLAALLKGIRVRDAIARLEGIDCGGKGTSCSGQFVQIMRLVYRHCDRILYLISSFPRAGSGVPRELIVAAPCRSKVFGE